MSSATLRDDMPLTPHFRLHELTITSNPVMQVANRTLTDEQVVQLTALASFCETIRALCGGYTLRVHSGYRAPALNAATIGSSSTSQHPKGEAVDFDILGQSVEETFNLLLAAARMGALKFGQLILEQAQRDYSAAKWVHASVPGTLSESHVGQVLQMQAGADGVPHYLLVERIS